MDPNTDSTTDRERAERFLNGHARDPEKLLELPKKLAKTPTFKLGLRVYERLVEQQLIDAAHREKVAQGAALCSYKDPDVPLREGLDRALEILSKGCDLERTEDPESLGIAGAVWKRMWECTGQASDLMQAYDYYRRSLGRSDGAAGEEDEAALWRQRERIQADQGYNAINAAFVGDVLAGTLDQAREDAAADEHRSEADAIRKLVGEVLAERDLDDVEPCERYWYGATQLEADFGRGLFPQAREKLNRILSLPEFTDPETRRSSTWMRQSTATQLAKLVRLRFDGDCDALEIIRTLVGGDAPTQVVNSLVLGKVGLALSGGGFRAALYHIGVLARLAELDALRHVEVISTVSGGSIVGAHYYLLLRRELQSKSTLNREDYIGIVRKLLDDFVTGVQSDVRATLYEGLPDDFAELLMPHEVVSERLADLYEKVFYWPAFDGGEEREPIHMDDLRIVPAGAPAFDFKNENWQRDSKVPALVINATTQNTGHVWQFTATYAGESPYAIPIGVDTNDRLRRFYYRRGNKPERGPIAARRVRLGAAVAASSCVPGLFPPTDLGERYPGYRVRLVDGGVHDNQGVVSLLEQGCTQLIVSDACGQMTTVLVPEGVAAAPLMRSNSIMMERVRQEEFARIAGLREAGRIDGFLFVHLRQGLEGDEVEWENCEDQRRPSLRDDLLDSGLRREYQRALAEVRTDLDAFSDVECYALMHSGYRMVEATFEKALPDMARLAPSGDTKEDWPFRAVAKLMDAASTEEDPRHARFGALLKASSEQFFRDAESEEQAVREYVTGKLKRIARRFGGVALGVLGIALVVGFVFGQLAGLWTLVGLIGAALAWGIFRAWATWGRMQKAAAAVGLEGPRETIPAFGYAAALWAVRRFSRFHLEHYRKPVLEKGTVESLGPEGSGAQESIRHPPGARPGSR